MSSLATINPWPVHESALHEWLQPCVHGRIKSTPEDFVVNEILGWKPQGKGKHHYLYVGKQDRSTHQMLEDIATACRCDVREVRHSGLKDKMAVTRQWISLPMQVRPDIAAIQAAGYTVEQQTRSNKALRVGVHRANQFEIRIRLEQPLPAEAQEAAMAQINARLHRSLNLYGAQRFGTDLYNWRKAVTWLESNCPQVTSAELQLHIGALRAGLFNHYVLEQAQNTTLDRLSAGKYVQFAGKRAGYTLTNDDLEEAEERFNQGVVSPTGPLVGATNDKTPSDLAQWQDQWPITALLERCKFEQRALFMFPTDSTVEIDELGIRLQFTLPSGCYATSVLDGIVASSAVS